MINEEKINQIDAYCKRHECVNDCKISEICSHMSGNFKTHPKELDEALKIIDGIGGIDEIDNVNHPHHYNQGNIECIDAMISAFGKQAVANFCMCNAFKYMWRHKQKGGIEDIDKMDWYLNKYKELLEGDDNDG